MPAPPFTPLSDFEAAVSARGFAVLAPHDLARLLDASLADLDRWHRHWDDLPPDRHLRDGGHYRRRRHACFVARNGDVTRTPHRPHWQPVEYNALHGGLSRQFEPMDAAWTSEPLWRSLIARFARCASTLRGEQPWYVEAHPFRIDTTGGIGRPTPEGAHRDGVDLVVVILVAREGVKGGETRVFEARSPEGLRFTMESPWTALVLDDERMIHETTPIQPDGDGRHVRDTLVVTFRARGFQAPASDADDRG